MADYSHNFDLVADQQDAPAVAADENILAGSPAMAMGVRMSGVVGFTFTIYEGKQNIAGTPTAFANQSFDLSSHPSTTVYIYVDSAGAFQVTTSIPSGWPGPLASSARALYTVTTDADGITGWTDWRCGIGGTVTLADVLAVLNIDNWVATSTEITITKGSKNIVLPLETP